MTNHWNDIDNASLVFVMGANPAENHPACFAHINAARARGAKLVVVDPRKTRTALQADDYVRIRPGSDIAFINAMLNYIFGQIDAGVSGYNAGALVNMLASHNGTAANSTTTARAFIDDRGAAVTGFTWPKYTDSRLLVDTTSDYTRAKKLVLGSQVVCMENATRQTVCTDADGSFNMWYVDAAAPGSFLKYASATSTGDTFTFVGATDVPVGNDAPFVWREGTTYYMINNDGGNNLELRSSTDKVAWTVVSAAVLVPTDVNAGLVKLDAPMVLKDGTTYYVYVQGKDAAGTRRIYGKSTTTAPGAGWVAGAFSAIGAGALLDVGAALKWDDAQIMHPFVRKNSVDARWPLWEMWYSGYSAADATGKIGYATSTDGVAWVKQAFSATQDFWFIGPESSGSSAAKPRIVDSGTGCWLYFESQTARVRRYKPSWISNFPVLAATVGTAGTVWQKLKAHAAKYDLATAAGICDCSQDDIILCAKYFIDHSRFASSDWNAAGATPQNGPNHPTAPYRATTWLYAMGGTQHSYGSQNIREYAVIQSLMGNMGRAGGGINALRGIHNVQGSTDMGLLYDTYPAYGTMGKSTQTWQQYLNLQFGGRTFGTGAVWDKYNSLGWQAKGFWNMTRQFFAGQAKKTSAVTVSREAIALTGVNVAFLKQLGASSVVVYKDSGATNDTWTLNTHYRFEPNVGALKRIIATGGIADGAKVYVDYSYDQLDSADLEALWAYWPKNNGYDHITAFRKMRSSVVPDSDRVKACYVIGQNPAVTEPNQSAVRAGLEDLDLLVVHEMFATETVQCKRKAGAVTYLIPACAHAEEAGSVTNSGRWLQWRQQASSPKGNSKTDLELVMRLAKALDDHSGFSHIPLVAGFANRWTQLYGYYTPSWTPSSGTFNSEASAENVYKEMALPLHQVYTVFPGEAGYDATLRTIDYSDPLLRGGTMWIYHQGYCNFKAQALPAGYSAFGDSNRAKSRVLEPGTANTYSKWGFAWLNNRRVFYNNTEVPQDQADNFVNGDYLARLFTNRNIAAIDYAGAVAYRNYKVMKDVSSVDTVHPNGVTGTNTYGMFPAHSEMVESNRPDLVTTWGHNNYIDTASYDAKTWVQASGAVFHECVPSDTLIGQFGDPAAGKFPLLLMTIRCVEHFQGGPITRNNPLNCEAEPEPWIEINPVDARKYGIVDGDQVNITTARSNSTSDQQGRTAGAAGFALGFRARVDNNIQVYQRVAPGIVAIPWHWGDRGLSVGSRANDLCIDASDANTKIPEYKACLCKIEKM